MINHLTILANGETECIFGGHDPKLASAWQHQFSLAVTRFERLTGVIISVISDRRVKAGTKWADTVKLAQKIKNCVYFCEIENRWRYDRSLVMMQAKQFKRLVDWVLDDGQPTAFIKQVKI